MYALVDEHLERELADPEGRQRWLVLDRHPDFPGYWVVEGFGDEYLLDLGEIIGSYRALAPSGLERFLEAAESCGYRVAFFEDPASLLEAYAHLNEPPDVEINSTFPNTVNGMLPFQVQGFNMLRRRDFGVARWDTGPQPMHAQLLTPAGWCRMGDITIGVAVIGSDGCAHRVTGVYPRGRAEVYRLTFKDGSTAESTLDHLWGFHDHIGRYYVRPLQDFLAHGLAHVRGDTRWFVDRVQPVIMPEKKLPLDPYLLGVLLGDGSLTGSVPQLYSHEGEIIEHIRPVLPDGMRVSQYGAKHFALVADSAPRPNPLKQALRELGLWGHTARDKYVPEYYMTASVEQRLALLQGLLDTDGSAERQSARFSSISRRLAEDVMSLARSLGGRAVLAPREGRLSHSIGDRFYDTQVSYRITLSLPPQFDYFRLRRKTVARRPAPRRNALVAVEACGVQEVQCISVDAPDHRYVTNDYVLTHNTGKTVLASALIKHFEGDYDLCFVVVKKNNKINTVRKLEALADVCATCPSGTKGQRLAHWEGVAQDIERLDGPNVVVLHYEQFKDFVARDKEQTAQLTALGERLFTDTRLMFVWDEMPTKLKTRTSRLYKAICKCVYRTAPPQVSHEQLRPAAMRAYMLSATPIENSPEDWFNCIRLLDGGRTYGTVSEFASTYVSSWNFYDPEKPETFHNLERMRLKAQSFVHQASKDDPDIAAVFPKAVEELVYIDWPEKLSAVYGEIQALARNEVEEAEVGQVPIFSLIGTLQMICDAPQMITDSAGRREVYEDALLAWHEAAEGAEPRPDGSEFALQLPEALSARLSNEGHPKLERLREILTERHPEAQVVLFSRFNRTIMPYLEAALTDWGISYGRYDGTERQRQAVQDTFQAGEIRVFLASDNASDSLDLDAGNVVVDYNLPWKWTTLVQRHNRVHRPTSSHDTVYYYSLLMENSVEERTLQIIERKRGYHNELFDPAAGDASASARLTREDLMYVLTGRMS